MPIGEILAGARQRAGLTVAEVSERTRIRPAVIEGIEGGDYSACGGDFYARANIRSIAKAVGADSGPLIAEYDALHRAPGVLSAVSLDELPAYRPPGRWLIRIVVLGLVAVLGFGVYSRFSGPRHPAAAPPAAGKHAATHQQGGHGRPGPAPTGSHAAPAPAPTPTSTQTAVAPAPAPAGTQTAAAPAPAAAASARTLTPASAGAPGPGSGSPTSRPQRDQRTSSDRAGSPAGAPPPAPERILRPAPAPGPAPVSHDRGCLDHHRQRAVQRAASGSCQYRPGRHHDLRPGTMERM